MKKVCLLLMFLFIQVNGQVYQNCAVTYELSPGRFADNLLSYIHAKWISYKYDIPLLYKPFIYSDQLALHEKELHFDSHANKYKRLVLLSSGTISDAPVSEPTLFLVPYFPESKYERERNIGFDGKKWPYFAIDWDNRQFISLLNNFIAPRCPIAQPEVPKDRLSVALHMRKGGNHDTPETVRAFPLKFVRNSFYTDQLKKIYEVMGYPRMYVHIFTDDNNPERLAKVIKRELKDLPLEVSYRRESNSDVTNVIEDFFALKKFDCLIHSESNFSLIMNKLNDYLISAYPTDCKRTSFGNSYPSVEFKKGSKLLLKGQIPERIKEKNSNFRLYVDSPQTEKIGYGNWNHFEDGEYEVVIKNFIKEGDIVFDAGAHKGDWSELVLNYTNQKCSLYSFEPVPKFFNELSNRVRNKAILCNQALGRKDDVLEMHYYYEESEGCSSLYERKVLRSIPVQKIHVPVTSVDIFCRQNNIDHIDFLKIDVEGAEWDLILGAEKMISEHKIPVIQFEYGGTYPDANITLEQVYDFFVYRGYAVFRIASDGLIHIPKWRKELENGHLSNWLAALI